jgi:hypothetical protein
MKQTLFSKIILGVMVLILVAGLLFVPTRRANAFLGIGDISFDPTVWLESILQFAETAAKWLAEEAFVVLRDAVVKRIVDDMTDQIIYSIENGGTPLFLQNPGEYLNKAGDITFNEFNNILTSQQGIDLCAPFQPQLTLYFYKTLGSGNQYYRNAGVNRCNFSDFKANIQNTESFIQRGGWVGIQQAFLPSNNLLGATLALESAYYGRVASLRFDREKEADLGKGFLSVKKCNAWESPLTGESVNADQLRADATQACIADNASFSCVDDLIADANCVKEETVTPGNVIADSATKGVLKDFEYASNVQSIVSALVNVFIKNVFDKGKGLIFASTSRGGSSLASNTQNNEGVGGTTLDDKWKLAQRTLNDIDYNYYRAEQYLSDPQNGLIPLAQGGRKAAIQAIYNCYMGAAKFSYDIPPYGWLTYSLGNNLKYTATLSSLVTMPLTTSTLESAYVLEGEPDLLSLIDRNPTFEDNGRVFPPPQDPEKPIPPTEGYFERNIRGLKAAYDAIVKERAVIVSLKDDLNKISTTTKIIITNKDNTTSSVDNIASSTIAFSRITSQASSAYSDFIARYKVYVSEALAGEQTGQGPGTLNGSGGSGAAAALKAVFDGLFHMDDKVDSSGAITGSGAAPGSNFYYCTLRK